MTSKPIYKPKGRALEYSPDALACNIYTECAYGCTYCWARDMAKRFGKPWTGNVKPRNGIVDAVKRQLEREQITGRLIHLCFTCDPYPNSIDTTATGEIIEAIKDSGNHVQILTKGGWDIGRDLELLDGNDWFGVSYTYNDPKYRIHEPKSLPSDVRIKLLRKVKESGIKTWVSCEPVLEPEAVYRLISYFDAEDYIDLYRIGKMNYYTSDINWGEFGRECERLCKQYGRNYYIKDDLRKEMEKREQQ